MTEEKIDRFFRQMPVGLMAAMLLLAIFLFADCLDGAFSQRFDMDVLVVEKEYVPPHPRFSGKYLLTFMNERIGLITWEVSAQEYDLARIGEQMTMPLYFGKWTGHLNSAQHRQFAFLGIFISPMLMVICVGALILLGD